MQQFQKQNQFKTSNLKKYQQSDTERLQHLWQKIQDLSEVQDESRNQQMPLFFDQNSMVSKNSEQESFINTVQMLDDCSAKLNFCQQINAQKSIENQYFLNEKRVANNNCKDQFSKWKDTKQQRNCGQEQQKQGDKFEINSSPPKTYQFKLFETQQRRTLNQNLSNPTIIDKQSTKTRQNQGQTMVQDTQMKRLKETNEKLLSDNMKLFDECIKLRKMILKLQNSEKNHQSKPQKISQLLKQHEKIVVSFKQKVKNVERQNECLMQKIKEKQKQHQNILLRKEYENRIFLNKLKQQSERQKQLALAERQMIHIRNMSEQKQLIMQLQSIVYDKQNQLSQRKGQAAQLQLKISQLSNSLDNEVRNCKQLKRLLQQKEKTIIQFSTKKQCLANFQPILQGLTPTEKEKMSRTNSIKSTSVSCSGSIFDKSTSSQGNNLEHILKDKQRQITNMKIVHEAEVKKYKSTINQLKSQIQLGSKAINLS